MRSHSSPDSHPGPRFCPGCRHPSGNDPERTLCGRCGGILELQGYCEICESRLRLGVGALCPKHDIALIAEEPNRRSTTPAARPFSWVTLSKFPDSLSVAPARIRLEAEGIPTFVDGERMGSPAMYRVATGGVKLQVPADMVNEARIILSQSWSLESLDDEVDDDLGEIVEDWEETSVASGPSRSWLAEAISVLVLASPLILWLLCRYYGYL